LFLTLAFFLAVEERLPLPSAPPLFLTAPLDFLPEEELGAIMYLTESVESSSEREDLRCWVAA